MKRDAFFPARYQCNVCGKRLTVFHLCPQCLQPIHSECDCHTLSAKHEQREGTADVHQSMFDLEMAGAL